MPSSPDLIEMFRREPETGDGRWGMVLLLAIVGLAIGFRIYLATTSDFPINDGALFLEFVRGVGASFPGLPETVAYNGIDVPFAYPPLSFWLGALLTRFGLSALDVVHYLPIAVNAVYVLLFAMLLIRGGYSRIFTAFALLIFCVQLRSFEWLVMGGGLSRGFGAASLILSLLAIGVPRPDRDRSPLPLWRCAVAGACVAAAILSHLEWGVLAAASVVLSRGLGARNIRKFLTQCALAGATAFLLILPWLLFVVGTHGLEPFFAAGGTSGWGLERSMKGVLAFAIAVFGNPFLLLGLVAALVRRDLFWPGFILLCLIVTPRHGPTPLTLATSVLCAHGLLAVLELLKRVLPSAPVRAAAAGVVLVGLLYLQELPRYRAAADQFRPLPPEVRRAMNWVSQHHPGGAFAVITPDPWYYDASAEWFPTLARGRSITTVQGREWLPGGAFARWRDANEAIVGSKGCDQLRRRLETLGRADFVWAESRLECFQGAGFAPVYRSPEVTIFKVSAVRPHSAVEGSTAEASSTSSAGASWAAAATG